jgi:3-oxoacyl-[acyl-carrier protein] reductase
MNFAGKTAIVTGSSKGIGRAILLRLASRGANVVVNYSRDKAAAEDVAAAAEKSGIKAVLVQADVSNGPRDRHALHRNA